MHHFKMLLSSLLATLSVSAQTSLHQQFQEIATQAKGKVAVYAQVLETGDTASLNAHAHAPMQSVYKFPIAMAVLHAVDQGKFQLDQQVHVTKADYIPVGHSPLRDEHPEGNVDVSLRELLRLNVAESDGSACDVLLRLLGGTAVADKYVHTLGVKEISIATTEKVQQTNDLVQYRNWATTAGLVQLLRVFYNGKLLSPTSQQVLLEMMINSTPGPHRIKGQLPAGTVVAHKTGTSGTHDGLTRATNDVGIITLPNGHHLLLAVLVSDSKADEDTRERVIAAAAKVAYDHWAGH